MAGPIDSFVIVDRTTEPRVDHLDWEAEVEERNKGPAKGTRFLVRALNQAVPEGYSCTSFWRNDFHTVDLKNGQIEFNTLPPVIGRVEGGDIVIGGSKIYLIGGLLDSSLFDETCLPPTGLHHVFLGGSCLDLSSHSHKWESIPETPNHDATSHCSFLLCGKIYCFGNRTFCPEVYDPNVGGQWNQLERLSVPSVGFDDDDAAISLPVLLDLDNKRILVHLEGSSKLFAFCPHDNGGDGKAAKAEWKLITDRLELKCYWEDAQAVVDNIIYFYTYSDSSGTVSAYDITKEKWLTCLWTSRYVEEGFLTTISPCPDNKETMYLVGAAPTASYEPGVFVGFLEFTVKRVDNSNLELNPVSAQIYRSPSTSFVLDFLAVVLPSTALETALSTPSKLRSTIPYLDPRRVVSTRVRRRF